jgi:hypothetical protein
MESFAFFWLVGFFKNIADEGIKNCLSKISPAELYSFCWLIGGLFVIGISPDKVDRRFVMFIVPLAILSCSFLFNKKYNFDFIRLDKFLNAKFLKIVFSVILALLIAAFIKYPDLIFSIREFTIAFIMLGAVLSLFFIKNKAKTLFFLFYGALFSYYFFGAVKIINSAWLVPLKIDSGQYLWNLVFAFLSFYLAYLFFFKNDKKTVIIVLLSIFFVYNFTMNYIWYAEATFTIKKASEEIRQYSFKEMPIIGGDDSHELAIENLTLPVWLLKGSQEKIYGKINQDYSFKSKKVLLIEYVVLMEDDNLDKKYFNDSYPAKSDFQGRNIKFLTQIKLYPRPFTQNYRTVYNLYEID